MHYGLHYRHPSAGMHLLRGEVLAYNMVNIFADAIFTLQKDLQKHTHSQLSKSKCNFFFFIFFL